MSIAELRTTIEHLLGSNPRKPVVVFAALWPLMRVMNMPKRDLPQLVLEMLQDIVGKNRSLLMPTFTQGYRDGICNLDEERSTTGQLSEMFRKLPQSQRNLSAFFSYAIIGPDTEEFAGLRPEHAWGNDSSYEWMEKNDVSFLMLGTHPTHCSYLHRMEWLARDKISYRYLKTFTGKIIRSQKEYEMSEKLYVRCLSPEVINDFTKIYQELINNGMEIARLEGIHLAHMTASKMRDAYLPLLLKDPFITVKNRQDFERDDNASDRPSNSR